MSLRLVVGRAGAGKSWLCLSSVAAAVFGRQRQRRALAANPTVTDGRPPLDPPLWVLVPEQATFQTLRDLVGGGYGLTAVADSDVRVVSFRYLAELWRESQGASALPVLSGAARLAVLGHVIDQRGPRGLTAFAAVADKPGLVQTISGLATELAEQCISVEDFAARHRQLMEVVNPNTELWPRRPDTLDDLAAKLADLRALMSDYRQFVAGRMLDADDQLSQAANPAALDWASLACEVWVDGFRGFTPQELAVLAVMSTAIRRVTVTMSIDPRDPVVSGRLTRQVIRACADRHDADAPVARTVVALRQMMARVGQRRLPTRKLWGRPTRRFDPARGGSTELGHLEAQWTESTPLPWAGEPTDVVITAAQTVRLEVQAAADEIVRLARERGWRYRDMALALPDLGGYGDLVAEVFSARGIPVFVDRRRSLAGHPLVGLVCQVATLMADPVGSHAAAVGGIKPYWPLLGLSLTDWDRLQRSAVEADRQGGSWWALERPWPVEQPDTPSTFDPQLVRQRVLAGLVALRGEMTPPPDAAPPTTRALVTALWAWLSSQGVPTRLLALADDAQRAGRLAEADEHRQALRLVCDTLDEMVTALGAVAMTAARWTRRLVPSLRALTIAQVPPTQDAVLVGDLRRSRFPAVRGAFVLGVGEGLFPRAAAVDPLFDETQRQWLAQAGTTLATGRQRQLFDEATWAYTAVTRAAQRLWLSWPRRDATGRPVNPSSVVTQLQRIFPEAPVRLARDEPPNGGAISTLDQLGVSLACDQGRWPRAQRSHGQPSQLLMPGFSPGFGAMANLPNEPIAGLVTPHDTTAAAIARAWLADPLGGAHPAAESRASALRAVLHADVSRPAPHLPTELIGPLWGDPLVVEVSQLERFAACPFRHFARHGLRPGVFALGRLALGPTPAAAGSPLPTAGGPSWDLDGFRRAAWDRFISCLPGRGRLEPAAATAEIDAAILQTMLEALPPTAGLSARQRFALDRARQVLRAAATDLAHQLHREAVAPVMTGVRFGPTLHETLPALEITLPDGAVMTLRGRIGRVDATAPRELPDQPRPVIIRDVGWGTNAVRLARLYHGLSLRPAVALMVLEAHGATVLGHPAQPVGIVEMPLSAPPVPLWFPPPSRGTPTKSGEGGVADPTTSRPGPGGAASDNSASPRDTMPTHPNGEPLSAVWRQRGLLIEDYLDLLDPLAEAGRHRRYQFRLDRQGQLVDRDRSDVLGASQLKALLAKVAQRLAALGAALRAGDVSVRPYRMGAVIPCDHCPSRGLCRFDASMHSWRVLPEWDRSQTLARLTDESRLWPV